MSEDSEKYGSTKNKYGSPGLESIQYIEGKRVHFASHPADLVAGIGAEKMVQLLEAVKLELKKATVIPSLCHPDSINYKMTAADLEFDKKQAEEITEALIAFFEGYVAG